MFLELHLQSDIRIFTMVLLNHRPFLFEINMMIENYPTIARAAASISQENMNFAMVLVRHASP